MGGQLALIVEDDYDLSMIFAQALEEAGFRTQIVRTGDTALMWLASEVPAVVVLDLHLPRVGGTDILRRIRDDARLDETKVIVVTADANLASSLDEGANLVLIKPVSYSQLRDLSERLAAKDAS